MMKILLICAFVTICLTQEWTADNIRYLHRLKSDSCDDERCPAPGNIDVYQQFCKYICPPHHRFVCLEDAEEKVIEFFMPDNLECEPGYRGNFSIDGRNTSRIVLNKLPCPSGTYQQYTSNCLDACVKQNPASSLPDWFKHFESGNTIEPMKVVCDHEKGYFSNTNRTWYYYDNNFSHDYWSYCEKIENNTCPDGQRPLKNGSCVCGFGHWSDDDSKCVPNVDSTKKPLQSTLKSTDTVPSSDVTSQSDHLTITQSTLIIVIIILVVGIGSGVAVFVFRQKCCLTINKYLVNRNTTYNRDVNFEIIQTMGSDVTNPEQRNIQIDSEDEE